MKKTLLIAVMLIAATAGMQAQARMSGKQIVQPAITDTLELANYIVYYNIKTPDHKSSRPMVGELRIGNKYVLFQDYYQFKMDSVANHFATLGKVKSQKYIEAQISVGMGKSNFEETVLRNVAADSISTNCYILASGYICYREPSPAMDWQVVPGDTIIGGYECGKATLDFGGRHYVAWYAHELELPYGPYKFGGCPGLIVDLRDTAGDYSFAFSGIRKADTPAPIYLKASYNGKTMPRDEYRRTVRNSKENNSAILKDSGVEIIGADGKPRELPKREYSPIELE